MVEDTVKRIEMAQRRLQQARTTALQIIDQQRKRLEQNRQVIDGVRDHTHR